MAESPLRITHVITRLIRGGADENTVSSCRSFAERGHDVTLVFGSEYSEEMVQAAGPGVRAIHLTAMRRAIDPSSDTLALAALRRHFRTLKPDIVHTHTSKAGILGRAAAIGLDGSAIVHGIHILPFVNVGLAQRWLYLKLERSLAPFTDRYVSVSAAMRDIAVAHGLGAAGKHHVVPSGMNLDRFRPWRASRARAAQSRFTVVYLANYEARKQHRELIEAIARAPERFADTTFLLAGHGSDQAGLEALVVRCNLQHCVKLLGYIQDPAELIASADLGLYCSAREGLPRAVIQYCAVGRPVVAFYLPGLEAVVRDGVNGFLCREGDFSELLGRVRHLLDDAVLRESMESEGANVDLSAWSADAMSRSLDTIYRDVLQARTMR